MEGICLGIKILSYHGYKPFEYAYLINVGLLIFLGLIFDQGVCFGVRKFLWTSIFRVLL